MQDCGLVRSHAEEEHQHEAETPAQTGFTDGHSCNLKLSLVSSAKTNDQ